MEKPYCHIAADFQEDAKGISTAEVHVNSRDIPALFCMMGHLVCYLKDKTEWSLGQTILMLEAAAKAVTETKVSSVNVRLEVPRK